MVEASVVIPTKDRWPLLARTLRSALGQLDVDHEVVVVDDGSSEPVSDRVRTLGDDRVRVVRHERSRGVSAARNTGLIGARGEFVGFLDDDDLWAPTKLATQLRLMRSSGRVWSYTNVVKFSISGDGGLVVVDLEPHRTPEAVTARLANENYVPGGGSGVVAERDVLVRVGGFDENLGIIADWELWLRLLGEGPPAATDERLLAYRIHGTNWAMRAPDDLFDDLDHMDAKHRETRCGAPLNRWPTYRWLGQSMRRGGDFAGARRVFRRALGEGHSEARRLLVRAYIPVRRMTAVLPQGRLDLPAEIAQWLLPLAEERSETSAEAGPRPRGPRRQSA